MSIEIDRNFVISEQVTITDSESTTGPVGFGTFAGGLVYVVSTSTGSAITVSWRGKHATNSPSYRLADSANSPITTTIQAGRCYEIPQELFGACQISAVAETAGQSATVRFTTKG